MVISLVAKVLAIASAVHGQNLMASRDESRDLHAVHVGCTDSSCGTFRNCVDICENALEDDELYGVCVPGFCESVILSVFQCTAEECNENY